VAARAGNTGLGTRRPPSGEQFEIAFADQRVVVVEVGGGLRTYSVGGNDVVDGYGIGEMSTGGRGQMLIPWPNRLQDGRYEFEGRRHQLPLTEPEHSNAIHGLIRWVAWQAREHEPHRVVLEHALHPQPGFPFALDLEIEYELSASGLTVRTTATNIGAAPCPYGSGAHPYLTLDTGTVDDLLLHVPARTALHSDDRGIPVGTVAVDGTELDFRSARRIGHTKLDHGYTDLERDDAGLACISVEASDGRRRTLWVDESYPYVMVFTGDIPSVERHGLAVEPMTCPPNAFRSGEALVNLEPGASHTAAWGLSPTR
jgi:aldose 1-epimerase